MKEVEAVERMPDDWREWYEYVVNEATDLHHDILHHATHCKNCEYAMWFEKDFDCVVPSTLKCPPINNLINQLTGRLDIAMRESSFD